MEKYTAKLGNWKIQDIYGEYRLVGDVFNDAGERFEDSTTIVTTAIQSIDFVKMEARTKNSFYKLLEV